MIKFGRNWTPEEEAILKSFWRKPGSIPKHMHLLPGRTSGAIAKRGQILGLGPRLMWTAEEDARLRKIWVSPGRIKSYMHEFPRHSLGALISHASELDLGRRPTRGRGGDTASTKIVMQLIKEGPRTAAAIVAISHLDPSTVHKALNEKRKAGAIHVSGWERSRRTLREMAVFKVGKGKDAPKLGPIPNAVKERRYTEARRMRLVQDGTAPAHVNPFATAMQNVMQEAA